MQKLIQQLNASFSLKQLCSLDYFLGIEVHSLSSGALLMTQSKYIRDLLQKTNMLEAKPILPPCTPTSGSPNMGLIYGKILLFRDLFLELCSMLQSLILNSVLLLTKYVNLWPLLLNPIGQL